MNRTLTLSGTIRSRFGISGLGPGAPGSVVHSNSTRLFYTMICPSTGHFQPFRYLLPGTSLSRRTIWCTNRDRSKSPPRSSTQAWGACSPLKAAMPPQPFSSSGALPTSRRLVSLGPVSHFGSLGRQSLCPKQGTCNGSSEGMLVHEGWQETSIDPRPGLPEKAVHNITNLSRHTHEILTGGRAPSLRPLPINPIGQLIDVCSISDAKHVDSSQP